MELTPHGASPTPDVKAVVRAKNGRGMRLSVRSEESGGVDEPGAWQIAISACNGAVRPVPWNPNATDALLNLRLDFLTRSWCEIPCMVVSTVARIGKSPYLMRDTSVGEGLKGERKNI